MKAAPVLQGGRTLMRLVGELQEGDDGRPLVVSGARELADALARELRGGAGAGAVRREATPEAPAAVIHVLTGRPDEQDQLELRAAARDRIPLVCVSVGREAVFTPYVLASRIVKVGPGQGFPLPEIGRALARAAGQDAIHLAARVPALRRAICDELVRQAAGRGGLIGVAGSSARADAPLLLAHQAKLVLGLAVAHGRTLGRARAPELVGVLASGLVLRRLTRALRRKRTAPAFAVQGAVAYAGTLAMGAAARSYFAATTR
ncbi:MAG: hypothetical protein ACXVZO_03250 [Gaiellaceae bacterium]